MNEKRVRQLNNKIAKEGKCVVYWMSRDQRMRDNWALTHANEIAKQEGLPLVVIFALSRQFCGATLRQYDFMLRGLRELQLDLAAKNIPLVLLSGNKKVQELVLEFCVEAEPKVVVTDFSPLRIGRNWREYVAEHLACLMLEVDAHNIIPAWVMSDHQEFAAHTIRPKIHAVIDEYLDEMPEILVQQSNAIVNAPEIHIEDVIGSLDIDRSILPVNWISSGERAAAVTLKTFLEDRLASYKEMRNIPSEDNQSNLSPYLHFGQISAQRIVIEVMAKSGKRLRAKLAEATDSAEAFLEELIVRRELADNYCLYNKDYDNLNGAPEWAKKTLNKHDQDKRTLSYTRQELELSQTHDELWNAAQNELRSRGKMHGYMRMYWAKKILEWTQNASSALEIAIYLNDKYELDGRDPNGYVGMMWSIAGLHDRPWFEREIFGLVRYMSESGLRSKFDVQKYINDYDDEPKDRVVSFSEA